MRGEGGGEGEGGRRGEGQGGRGEGGEKGGGRRQGGVRRCLLATVHEGPLHGEVALVGGSFTTNTRPISEHDYTCRP